MDLTFTGIHNLKIQKKEFSKYGAYLSNDFEIKEGEKFFTTIKISANLADDEAGKDLTEFKNYLNRSNKFLQRECLNKENPNKVEILINRQEAKDENLNIPTIYSTLKLNGCDITPENDSKLVIYTYLARFTRKLAKTLNLSKGQQYYTNLANKSIDEEARRCLDVY